MYQRSDIKEGMTVSSIDGTKLGRVFAIQDGEFLIERGLFFPKDYACRFSEISDIRNGEIILSHGKEGLQRLSAEEDRLAPEKDLGLGTGMTSGAMSAAAATTAQKPLLDKAETKLTAKQATTVDSSLGSEPDVVMPLYKEELDAIKHEKQAGEIRVHKDVLEEEKEIMVPVRRERVRVERRQVPDRPVANASFKEETVVVPVRTEEVELLKHAVVTEEVVIHKDAVEEEQRVAGTVRHEEVEIRGEEEEENPRKLDLVPDDPTLRRS